MKRILTTFFTSAVLWGTLAGVGFYAAIHRGMITNELVVRYAAGHPVEYVTVVLFLIGMTSLFFKSMSILRQRRTLALGPIFSPIRPEREDAQRADEYLQTLEKAEPLRGGSYHLTRLRRALLFLKSSGRADELDSELRCLADEDALAAESDYGMVRMFIWAIPILGFLGTVMGITVALGNLNLTDLETSGDLLAAGLKVAFDTTALALSLVFVLYFSLFFTQRRESRLFAEVDRLVESELKGRFVPAPSLKEQEEFRAVRRIMKSVVESFDKLMKRQVEIWDEAISGVNKRSAEVIQKGAEQIHLSLRNSLRESVESHARIMLAGEEKMLSETLSPYVRSMKDHAEQMAGLQEQMISDGKTFREILRATGEVTMLEDRLNENLRSLSEANCFSETVNSLAATIHLLNTKLGGSAAGVNYRVAGISELAAGSFERKPGSTAESNGDSEEVIRMSASDKGKSGLFSRKGKKGKSA